MEGSSEQRASRRKIAYEPVEFELTPTTTTFGNINGTPPPPEILPFIISSRVTFNKFVVVLIEIEPTICNTPTSNRPDANAGLMFGAVRIRVPGAQPPVLNVMVVPLQISNVL